MINNSRSAGIIDPEKYSGNIHIVGAGATGSRIAKSLIELGFKGKQINVYDFDEVEEHNVNNQLYTLKHVGMLKVDALLNIIEEDYGETIHSHNCRVDSDTLLDGVVFLLTDTMSSREEIFDSMVMNPSIKLIVETRLDPRAGYIHTLNPCNISHNEFFKETIFDDDDEDVEVSACGTRQTIGHVVDILSGMAMAEFVKFVNEGTVGKQIFFAIEPYYIEEKILL